MKFKHMVIDMISDSLARIQNGLMRKSESVTVLNSKIVEKVLSILKKEQMIADYQVDGDEIIVKLLYVNDAPAVTKLTMVSKPGQRVYVKAAEILPVMNGRGISIISTSEGVLSGALAKSKGLGGEYICNIW